MTNYKDIFKPWKWRRIYKANKAMKQIGQLSVLKKKYESMSRKAVTHENIRMFKSKHKEVSAILKARLDAFTFTK